MTRERQEPQRPPIPVFDAFPAPPSTTRPEIPEPPPVQHRHRALVVVALVVGALVVGVGSGFGIAAFLDRGPCHGAGFVSASFDYCVEPPAGWVASPASEEESGKDMFRKQDGATVVAVVAASSEDETLQGFADQVRQLESLQGSALGDAMQGSLDGSPTLEWDARISSQDQETLIREIVVLREGRVWLVQIADGEGEPPVGVQEAGQLVASWRFAT